MYKNVKELKESGIWENRHFAARPLVHVIKSLGSDLAGLEIGVAFGENMVFLMEQCPEIQYYIGMDPWCAYTDENGSVTEEEAKMAEDLAHTNLDQYIQEHRAILLKGKSEDLHDCIAGRPLDFIFIDGAHDFKSVFRDLAYYYPKVKSGGMIAGHDCYIPEVFQAINLFCGLMIDVPPSIRTEDSAAWYFIKG